MSEATQQIENFHTYLEELFSFRNAMLVTRDADGKELHARPMFIAGRSNTGSVWFFTHIGSLAITDITEHPEVSVCLQNRRQFVSISGTARLSRDPEHIRRLWSAEQTVWFEEGADDPEVVLIEVVPTYAKFWDRSGVNGIRFALTEIAAIATGKTLDESQGYLNGSVEFDRSSDQTDD